MDNNITKYNELLTYVKQLFQSFPTFFGEAITLFSLFEDRFYRLDGIYDIFIEFQLKGTTSCDFSIGYNPDKSFVNPKCISLEEKDFYEKIGCPPYYLEFDSNTPKDQKPCFFISLTEFDSIEKKLNYYLNLEKIMHRKKAVFDFYNKIKLELQPVHIGYFSQRTHKPLRLTCKVTRKIQNVFTIINNSIDSEFENFSYTIINKIISFGFFHKFCFDFDILDNNSFGNRISFEFKLNVQGTTEMKNFLKSTEWMNFCTYIMSLGISDDRILHLSDFCFYEKSEKNINIIKTIFLCHFKITWNNGILEPLKVYLKSKYKSIETIKKRGIES